jgi:hypothetical protein
MAVLAQAEALDAETVHRQLAVVREDRLEHGADLAGVLAAADPADVDERHLGQADASLAVQLDATQVVVDRVALQHRHERAVGVARVGPQCTQLDEIAHGAHPVLSDAQRYCCRSSELISRVFMNHVLFGRAMDFS